MGGEAARGCVARPRANEGRRGGPSVHSDRPVVHWAGFGLAAAVLAGCGSDNGPWYGYPQPYSPPLPNDSTFVRGPAVLDLYPSTQDDRLYVIVTAVGTQPVHMPLVFDTGSAGITLNAQDIFPSSVVGPGGFRFPEGGSSMTYNGIIVTNQQATRDYGGANGTVEHGNIGFAAVTFGDDYGQLRTSLMPVFLYYAITQAAPPFGSVTPAEQGLFGVDPLADKVVVSQTAPPAGEQFPECAPQTAGTCYTVSVLKYLEYAEGLDAGFVLTPASLQACDISQSGECAPVPMLTVGLTDPLERGFSAVTLVCPPTNSELPAYYGPQEVNGYMVCEKSIPNSTVSLSGPVIGSLTGRVLFDSGTPAPYLYPADSPFPATVPTGTMVLVSLPSGFTYTYTAGSSPITDTSINSEANNDQNHIGVAYFTTNSFFIDYKMNSEGWQ